MFLRRFLCIWIILSFLASLVIPSQAQSILNLPEPGSLVSLSPAYTPILIKGLRINPNNPLALDFIVAAGNSELTGQDPQLRKESEKLIKYFFAALTLPEKDVWVNLSPYEKDRIIPKATGQTEMGRDMLAQDYILKQITSSLIYPEKNLGRDFWNRIYAEASQRFGSTQIPVNTFNKVWIVADKASVYEAKDTVFVVGSHLKVMLEEDYLSLQKHKVMMVSENGIHSIGSAIVRQIVLPALEKEVNEGKNFAPLRQIFNSLILAKWYKETLKTALLNQVYSNKNKISGLSYKNMSSSNPTYIYQQYLKAYKKGVFNYIKEDDIPCSFDCNASGQQVISRKYFSGGVDAAMSIEKASMGQAVNSFSAAGHIFLVASLARTTNAAMMHYTKIMTRSEIAEQIALIRSRAREAGFKLINVGEDGRMNIVLYKFPDRVFIFSELTAFTLNRVRNTKNFRMFLAHYVQRGFLPKMVAFDVLDPLADFSRKADKEILPAALPFKVKEDFGYADSSPYVKNKHKSGAKNAAMAAREELLHIFQDDLNGSLSGFPFQLKDGKPGIIQIAITPVAGLANTSSGQGIIVSGIDHVKEGGLTQNILKLTVTDLSKFTFKDLEAAIAWGSRGIVPPHYWDNGYTLERLVVHTHADAVREYAASIARKYLKDLQKGDASALEEELVAMGLQWKLIKDQAGKDALSSFLVGQDGVLVAQSNAVFKALQDVNGSLNEDSFVYMISSNIEPFKIKFFVLVKKPLNVPDVAHKSVGVTATEVWLKLFKNFGYSSKDFDWEFVYSLMNESPQETSIAVMKKKAKAVVGILETRGDIIKVEGEEKWRMKEMPVTPGVSDGKPADAAMNGGIDLNASKLNLQRAGSGIDIKFDPAMVTRFRQGDFDGIVPLITSIMPINDIYSLFTVKSL